MDIILSMEIPTQRYSLSRILIWIILFGIITIILYTSLPSSTWSWLGQRLSVFATVFLGIFIEALPFLLMGTLSSGLVEVFLSDDWLARSAPRRALPAALVGASLGLIFPICECGTVPLARRLFRKGSSAAGWHRFFISRASSQPNRDIEHGDRIRLGTNVIVAARSQLVDGGIRRLGIFHRKRFSQHYADADI